MKKALRVVNPNEYGSLLFDKKEEKAVKNVIKSKRIFRYSRTKFSYVDAFEDMICKKFNVKHCLGIANGTAGLVTALKAIHIEPNDRVLVSSFTYISTALAVVLCGATPIPMEIDFEDGINFEDLECEIKKGCKAVIVTHLQGRCFNLKKLYKFLKEKNIYLIEDACQGFASNFNGKYAGTFGDIGVYSFQQFKQVSAGEGGAIVTNDSAIYEQARNYSDMGSVRNRFPNWDSEKCLFGENYRISQLAGAVIFEQFKKLDKMLESQHASRNYIMNKLSPLNIQNFIHSADSDGDTAMNIVIALNNSNDRDVVIKEAKERFNVEIRKMWSGAYFENELFKKEKLTDIDLKGKSLDYTKDVISKMIVLSIPPLMSKSNCDRIVDTICYLYENKFIN